MALDLMRRPDLDPMREMVPLRTMMDRLLESAFTSPPSAAWSARTGYGMDAYENDDAFLVRFLLPGIDPNAVNITVQDNVLTVSGESKRDVPDTWRPLAQEIGYGEFQRQVTLGMPVEAAKAEATYHDGILSITLPKSEAVKPRTIKIQPRA